LNKYPIPKIEDLFAKLSGGKIIHQAGHVSGLSAGPAG